jgi:hypothetical protein
MGYQTEEAKEVLGYGGRREKVEFIVKTAGYSIGFRKNRDEVYEIVTDWWGVKGINEKEFTTKLKTVYAEIAIRNFARRKGFTVIEKQPQAGTLKQLLLIRRSYS